MTNKILRKSLISLGNQSLRAKYASSLTRYSNLDYFGNLTKRDTMFSITDSMADIGFEYGISIKKLHMEIGKPLYQTNLAYSMHHKILMYENQVAGLQMTFEFHFFKDKLFFFNKTFPINYFWTNDEMEILEVFCQKYQIKETGSVVSARIMDLNGMYVYIDLSNSLTICNINMNSETFAEVIVTIGQKMSNKKSSILSSQHA